MSDYAHRPGGKLKLKGDDSKKKKKKKSHSSSDRERISADLGERDRVERSIGEVEKERERGDKDKGRSGEWDKDSYFSSKDAGKDDRKTEASHGGRKMTEAERRFEEVQRQRREERVRKNALLTHKDRVSEFNAKLEALSEHHDLPKIGPG